MGSANVLGYMRLYSRQKQHVTKAYERKKKNVQTKTNRFTIKFYKGRAVLVLSKIQHKQLTSTIVLLSTCYL